MEVNKADGILDKAINECKDSILKIKLQDAKKVLSEVNYSEPTESVLTQLLTYLDLTTDLQSDASEV